MRFQSRDCRQHYVWRRPRDHICDWDCARAHRRADDRVQPALPDQTGPCGCPAAGARRAAESSGLPAWRLRHSDRVDPRGAVRHVRRRHTARVLHEFDGSWDAYMDDFFNMGATLALFDATFRHTEGYDGLPDMAALHAFVRSAEKTAVAYARNYPGTVKEIRKALRVTDAFQRVLDDPSAA